MTHFVRMLVPIMMLAALGLCQPVAGADIDAVVTDNSQEKEGDQTEEQIEGLTGDQTGSKTPVSKYHKLNHDSKAIASMVFLKNGRVVVLDGDGKRIRPCAVCSPQLEKKWGSKCSKAPSGRICQKLMDTDVRSVKAFTVMEHTGSTCWSSFMPGSGQTIAYEICW